MTKLSKHSSSAAEGSAASPALKKRPSRLLSLFKKPSFIKKVGDKSFFKQPGRGKRATIGNVSSTSMEEFLRAMNQVERIAGIESQRSRNIQAAFAPRYGSGELIFFRCDIHAVNGNDFTAAENECKQLVAEAGGTVMVEYEYIGDFLYNFPADMDFTNPLTDNEETENGGFIKISPWKPFITKRLDPLRVNPPDELGTPPLDTVKNEHDEHIGYKDKDKQLPGLPAERRAMRGQNFQDWILQQTEMAQRTCMAPHEGNNASSCTLCEDFDDDDLTLGPRILDPGVELAILDPNLIRSGVSLSGMSIIKSASRRASWSEKEVYYPASDTECHPERTTSERAQGTAEDTGTGTAKDQEMDDATTLCGSIGSSQRYSGVEATAVSAHIGTPVLVRSFGEEMRRVEQRYRNWVPEMTSRSRLNQEMQEEDNA